MIKVLHAGLHTSIQDLGRFGYRNHGVPVSGVMDEISASLANALLNNDSDDAIIEITLQGPELLFMTKTNIVITGAEMSAKLNDEPIHNYHPYQLNEGDKLSFGELTKGLRSYLAVQGGIQSEIVLNSRSFYKDITDQDSLKVNDSININSSSNGALKHEAGIKSDIQFYETNDLQVYRGPDFDLFSNEDHAKIVENIFTISNDNNRMGYQLEEVSVRHTKSIITSPVLPGTIQLTPAGKLIILLKDAQTTGGYPRVLQLSKKSIAVLSQKKVHDKIKFKLLT